MGDRSRDGIKAYTKVGLRVYDTVVMRWLAKSVWGCPAANFVQYYRKQITSNHAEIGVGTGYCLDRCGFDTAAPRLVLIDLQPNCLEHAAKRLARYRPQVFVRDALQPMQSVGPRFGSVALGGVLHCLPGDGMRQKSRVFDTIEALTGPGSKVFGYSLIADRADRRWRSRLVLSFLNRLGVVNNTGDRVDDLIAELSRRFVACVVERVGSMVFFSAVVPPLPGDNQLQGGAAR